MQFLIYTFFSEAYDLSWSHYQQTPCSFNYYLEVDKEKESEHRNSPVEKLPSNSQLGILIVSLLKPLNRDCQNLQCHNYLPMI